MIKGPVISAVIAVAASIGVVLAFSSGSNPYVTMSQARTMKNDDGLHLAGDLVKGSVNEDMVHHTLQFKVKDQNGELVSIVHKGEMPQNMSEATKVVAIGYASGDVFESHKLLVKCPSKYEADTKRDPSSYASS